MTDSYRLPLIISVLMHALLLVMVTWGWSASSTSPRVYTPRYVEATLVELKPKTVKKASPKKKQVRKVDVAAKRRQQEQQKRAAEKKRQHQLKLKRETEEKARQAKLKEQERLRKEQERQAEAKRQQETERQQSAFDDALAEEEALLSEEEDEATAQSYVSLIVDRIERNWSRPPSARRGMVCELRLQLVPTGEVVNVSISKSSGNTAFDRSAEQAVKKAGRFVELQQVPPEIFEAYFRQLTIKFDPKDLRL